MNKKSKTKKLKTPIVLVLFILFFNILKGQKEITLEALNVPVLMTVGQSSGSGFFYRDSLDIYIVTAKHIVFNFQEPKENGEYALRNTTCNVQYYEKNSDRSEFKILTLDLVEYLTEKKLLYNVVDDVIVIPICTLSPQYIVTFNTSIISKSPMSTFSPRDLDKQYVRKFDDVKLGNDIYLFGYPKSLGLQDYADYNFNIPLLRKGTLAGKNTENRKFVIDCPAYGGNSGGPVFNYSANQKNLDIVGIVVSYIPYVQAINVSETINVSNLVNSGYSIVEPMEKVLDLILTKRN